MSEFKKINLGDDDTLYFLHIPKTAGTTLINYLDSQFDKKDILKWQRWKRWWNTPHFKNSVDVPHAFDGHKLIRGHWGWSLMNELSHKPITITVMRDPIKRAVSVFGHIMHAYNSNPDYVHRSILASDSINDIPKDEDKLWFFDNRMSLIFYRGENMREVAKAKLGPDYINKTLREANEVQLDGEGILPTDQERFEKSMKRVESLDLIMIQEYFQESLILLAAKFGWHPMRNDFRMMVHKTKPKDKEVLESTLQAFKEVNGFDYKIYNYGLERFKKEYLSLIEAKLGKALSWENFEQAAEDINDQLIKKLNREYKRKMIFTSGNTKLKIARRNARAEQKRLEAEERKAKQNLKLSNATEK